MPAWPADLPQYFLQNGFRMQPEASRRGFRPDRGPEIRRRRFTGKRTLIQGVLRCTPTQWDTLKGFYQDDLEGGAEIFTFPKPLRSTDTDVITVRFTRPPQRRKSGINWDVTVNLRTVVPKIAVSAVADDATATVELEV